MKKSILVLISAIFISLNAWSQDTVNKSIWVIDYIKFKPGKEKEALYFYENNWLVFRKGALAKGYIKSYQLLRTQNQDINQFDLILMTEFADSTSHSKMEENFREVMEARTGGALFLNDLRPKGFMEFVNSVEAISLNR